MPYPIQNQSMPYRQPPATLYKHHNKKEEEQQRKKAEQQQMQNQQYRPAQSIQQFKDLEGIGQGAFAQVFKGYELMSAADAMVPSYREVALKRINLSAINEPAVLRTTLNEVNLFKELVHENIVRCYYSFEETSEHSKNRYLILVMEYVDGGDLENFLWKQLSARTLLPEYKLWTIFAQITDALAYIHSKRIIHRDLKPANVLMMADETVKLADFGLSRLQKVAETSAKTVCGTPYYMAPERIEAQPYKFKSDIWSAGCILYEMATLKSPFCGEKHNATSLVEKIRTADYPPLPQDCYNVQVGMLIDICLQPEFQKRPPASELHRVASTMAQRCAPPANSTPSPRRRTPLRITRVSQ